MDKAPLTAGSIPDYWAKSENVQRALMLAADIFDARR